MHKKDASWGLLVCPGGRDFVPVGRGMWRDVPGRKGGIFLGVGHCGKTSVMGSGGKVGKQQSRKKKEKTLI